MRKWLVLAVVAVFVAVGYLGVVRMTQRELSKKEAFQRILHETTKNPFVENSSCGKWFRVNEFLTFTDGDTNGESYGVTKDTPSYIYVSKTLAFAAQVLFEERYGKNGEISCLPNGPSSTDNTLATARDYLKDAQPTGLERQLEAREAMRTIQGKLNRRAGQYAEISHELLLRWMSTEADILKETSRKELEELNEVRGKRPVGWEKFLKK